MVSRCLGGGGGEGGTDSTVQSVPGQSPSLVWKHSLKSNATLDLLHLNKESRKSLPLPLSTWHCQTTLTPESLMKDWNQQGIVELLATRKGFTRFWVEISRLLLLGRVYLFVHPWSSMSWWGHTSTEHHKPKHRKQKTCILFSPLLLICFLILS